MKWIGVVVLSGLICFSLTADLKAAEDFGIIMDTAGTVTIQRDTHKMSADLAMEIDFGDIITIAPESSLTVVGYDNCDEYVLKGKDTFVVGERSGIQSARSRQKIAPTRKLPVCYSADEVSEGDTIGGFIVRGNDELSALRKEFAEGKASNATLLTLIMHDIINGKVEQARPYYDELKKRKPGDPFVKKLAKIFEKK